MNENIELKETAKILKSIDNINILCHNYPDGDTLGSAAALCAFLRQKGKKCNIICNQEIPKKFEYIFINIVKQEFVADSIVCVDVADEKLLGEKLECYKGKVDLCIDHHGSNTKYAKKYCVEETAAATCEMIAQLAQYLEAEITSDIADSLFTGICTDTGCFKYSNVTAKTHRIAGMLIEKGARAGKINRLMFDTKSKERIKIEQLIMSHMTYHFDNICALTYVLQEDIIKAKATESDMDGLAAIPRQIEGVKVGIYIRQKEENKYKISLRTLDEIDASMICSVLGGGGHRCAAGCEIEGTIEQTIKTILEVVKKIVC